MCVLAKENPGFNVSPFLNVSSGWLLCKKATEASGVTALCSQISQTGNLFRRVSELLHHGFSRLPSVWVLTEISVRICGSDGLRCLERVMFTLICVPQPSRVSLPGWECHLWGWLGLGVRGNLVQVPDLENNWWIVAQV